MMTNKKYMTWSDIDDKINLLLEYIRNDYTVKFDYILCIGRGGLVPSSIIANALHLDVLNIGLRSRSSTGEQRSVETYQEPITSSDDRILVVDDIFDTGRTIEHIDTNILGSKTYAVVCMKKSSLLLAAKYDTLFASVEQDKDWIVFPWERDIQST